MIRIDQIISFIRKLRTEKRVSSNDVATDIIIMNWMPKPYKLHINSSWLQIIQNLSDSRLSTSRSTYQTGQVIGWDAVIYLVVSVIIYEYKSIRFYAVHVQVFPTQRL